MVSDAARVASCRAAEATTSRNIITTTDYLDLRLKGKGARLEDMLARKWATWDQIFNVIRLFYRHFRHYEYESEYIESLHNEISTLTESAYVDPIKRVALRMYINIQSHTAEA